MFEQHEKQLSNKNICTSCGHSGKLQSHTKNGNIKINHLQHGFTTQPLILQGVIPATPQRVVIPSNTKTNV